MSIKEIIVTVGNRLNTEVRLSVVSERCLILCTANLSLLFLEAIYLVFV